MKSELEQQRAAEILSGPDGLRHLQIQTLALESIGNAVLILDTDGTIQFSNHACHEMYGYSADELFGRSFTILSPPEVKPRSIQMLKDSLESGWHGEVTRAKKSGEKLQIDLTLEPIRDPEGKTIGLIGVGQEITARKLDEEEQRRISLENATLAEIARILSSSLDVDEAFGKYALEMRKLVDFDRASFTRLNEADSTIDVKRVYGDRPGRPDRSARPLEGSLTEHLLNTGKGLIRPEITKDPRFASDLDNINAGFRSGVAVPIMVQGRLIASLSLLSRRVGTYGDSELALLERLATQIAPPLETARLYEEANDRAQEVQAINKIASIMASDLDLGHVFDRFAEEARNLIDFDRVAISIIDQAAKTLRMDYISDSERSAFKPGDSVDLDGTMAGEVVRTRRPLVVDDMAEETGFWVASHVLGDGIHSCVSVPLFSNEKIIAVLLMMRSQPYAFGSTEVQLMERLAAQIAPAVQNALLFQEVELQAFALESIGEGLTFVDDKSIVRFVNRAFEEMYGFSRSEVIGKSISSIVSDDPSRQAQTRQIQVDGLAGGWNGEIRRTRRSGESFDNHLSVNPVTGREGRVIGVIGVNRDITERKKAEAELLLRNQELESLVYIASVLVQGGSFQDKCADALQQLALSVQAELVTLRVFDVETDCFRLISHGGPAQWEQENTIARDSATGQAFDTGTPIVVNDYLESPLARAPDINRGLRSVVCFPIKIGADQPLGVVNVGSHEKDHFTPERIRLLTAVTDGIGALLENARLYQQTITELEQRQRAEEALRESEARFRQLYDEAPVGYHEVDAEGRINRVNRTELEMLGYTADEMLGRRIWEFIVEEETSRQTFHAKMAGTVPPGQGYERTFMRKDGSTISALIEDRQLFDDQDRIVGIRSAIQDITERKQTEERLTETARLVSVGELAAGVAHEINNPLTVVSGFSELLVNIDLPEPASGYAQLVHDEAQRTTKVVQNLLSFARRHVPEKRCMNVSDVVERALELKSYDFKNSSIQVCKELSQKIPNTLLDEHQLLQVFTNLITNAEQALAASHTQNARITIRARRRANRIRISFVDNGPGIPKETMTRIFDPFFTTKEVGGGTGLGLSICYGIVQQHGGDLWADSRMGEGTSFHIELPIVGNPVDEPELQDAQPGKAVEAPLVSGKHILVVDDEPGIRELLTDFLSADGHDVEVAADVQQAWTMMQDQEFDLLLVDLRMPGAGGRELYERLNGTDEPQSCQTIFITGDTARPGVKEFLESTGNPVLSKPFRKDELRAAIYDLTNS